MKSVLRCWWRLLVRVSGNFWAAPMALGGLAVGLAALSLWLDATGATAFLARVGPPFSFEVEGARTLLATVAGSIVTVASLVFSLTLVALTLAAGNIGSRLLQRYMRKTTMQMTLGIFVATFLYAMVVLSVVAKGAVPPLSLGVSLLLAILSIFWLVYAFHDLARSIQVDNAVAELARDLHRDIRRRAVEAHADLREIEPARLPVLFSVRAEADGYLQAVDHEGLIAAARRADAVVTLRRRSGDFVLAGEELAGVAMAVPRDADAAVAETLRKAVLDALVLGARRAQGEDPTFAVHLVVEIAGRALSPGVNDFYTALACVDHLGAALASALRLNLHRGRFGDEDGCLRLISNELTFEMIAGSALDPLRQCASGYPPMLLRLMEMLARLAPMAAVPGERELLAWHGRQCLVDAARLLPNPADHDKVVQAHRRLEEALAAKAVAEGAKPQSA